MENSSNNSAINAIAGHHLGKKGGEGYSDQYDPTLLVKVPRSLNRVDYGIKEESLPFTGYDVWNAYETSTLTKNGLPVAGQLKIKYSSDSKYHVESKSLKLYLNSYNMTKVGKTYDEAAEYLQKQVSSDLSKLLETEVEVSFYVEKADSKYNKDVKDTGNIVDLFNGQNLLNEVSNLDQINFTDFRSNCSILEDDKDSSRFSERRLYTDILRSNCRVTNQPDHGTLFISMKANSSYPSPESLLKYIVSHRQVNHFHEEICEFIYTDLKNRFDLSELTVACLYARRGGICINPIRSTSEDAITFWNDTVGNMNRRMMKTSMQ